MINKYTNVHTHTHTHTHIHIYIYIYIYIYTHTRARAQTHTQIYIYIYIYILFHNLYICMCTKLKNIIKGKRYNNNKPLSLTKLILCSFILHVFHSAFVSCFLFALPAYVRRYQYVCVICRPYLCFIRNINYCFEKKNWNDLS